MGSYYLLIILIALGSGVVAWRFKAKFKKYSGVPLSAGLSGKEIAEKMLRDNGIYDVQVLSSEGMLSDHYNPLKKTVNLSPDVYNGRSVAAAAVAAHECAHAVQHAQAYAWLKFRSAMVPVVSVTSNIVPWVLIGGALAIQVFPYLLLFGIILFALNIETRPVWRPMHLQPAYQHFPYFGGRQAEMLHTFGICLPSGSSLTESQQGYVIDNIKRYFRQASQQKPVMKVG